MNVKTSPPRFPREPGQHELEGAYMFPFGFFTVERLPPQVGNAIGSVVSSPGFKDGSTPDQTGHTATAVLGGALFRVWIVPAATWR